MVTVIKPPDPIYASPKRQIFLAGSIEMGKAEDWQKKVADILEYEDVILFNPRRDDWDTSWKQEKDNPQFRGQVEWELEALEQCDTIFMYLSPGTISPISLLELGLFTDTGGGWNTKMIVCCPEGFHRKGNVDIVCERYGVDQIDSLEELYEALL